MCCSYFFFYWCFALLFYQECHSSFFSAHQGTCLKCSANVMLSQHYFCHPTDCNAFFSLNSFLGLHLCHQLISELFTSLISLCGFHNVASPTPTHVCWIPSLAMDHEPTWSLWRLLKETQLLSVRLWTNPWYIISSCRNISITLFTEVWRKEILRSLRIRLL